MSTEITSQQLVRLGILCETHPLSARHSASAEYGGVGTALLTLPGPFRAARIALVARMLYAIGTRALALQCFLDQWRAWWPGRPIYRTNLQATREVCEEFGVEPTTGQRDAQAFRDLLASEIPNWSDGGGNPSLN
jgi:hypothetical protein